MECVLCSEFSSQIARNFYRSSKRVNNREPLNFCSNNDSVTDHIEEEFVQIAKKLQKYKKYKPKEEFSFRFMFE